MSDPRGTGLQEQPRSLPDGLASMPPGPQLAALLASVDRSTVTAEDLPELVRARARLLAFEQAEFLLDLVEAVRGAAAEPGSTARYDDEQRQDDATVEVGWTLRWSGPYTATQIRLAQDLVNRLPMVLDALRAGRLDRERALAFADSLRFVDDDIARAVAAKLVDRAEAWTLGQLRDKLRYHIDRADPEAKRRRYRKAVTERGVWLRATDDGTANLAGVNLPPHRAAAAFDRIDRLARAARRDGDVRTLSQLRADAFTDLLTGTPFQINPTTDPITADADATHPRADPDLLPPHPPAPHPHPHPQPATTARPDTTTPDTTTTHDTATPDTAGPETTGPQTTKPGTGSPNGHLVRGSDHTVRPGQAHPPHDPNRIDLYDYDEWCLTDEDRWWLHHLHAQDPEHRDPPTNDPGQPDHDHSGQPTHEPGQPGHDPGQRDQNTGRSGQDTGQSDQDSCRLDQERAGSSPSRSGGPDDPTSDRQRPTTDPGTSPNMDRGNPPASTGRTPHAAAGIDLAGFAGAPLAGNRCVCGGLLPPRHPHSADVHIELTTLIGLDDHPALIPGLGPIPAELARFIAHDQTTNPVWRWSVYDTDGQLRHHGYTTCRPTTTADTTAKNESARPDPARSTNPTDVASNQRWCRCTRYDAAQRRGTVELLLTTTTLADLLANPHRAPGYQRVIADIVGQVERDTPPSTRDTSNTPPHHDHTGRHPTAAEAAFIRARDRSCRAPNCRKPATACEIDHIIEYAKGGPSHRGNCECRCKRHHALRHRTGYTITKPGHTTIWTTRNGRTYPVPPDKDIIPTNE